MTLLVFQLVVPLTSGTLADTKLSQLLFSMWPKFIIYGFIVVAFVISMALGKWELVMVWSRLRKNKKGAS